MVGSDPKGSLTAAKIKESVLESLEALRVDEVGFSIKIMKDEMESRDV